MAAPAAPASRLPAVASRVVWGLVAVACAGAGLWLASLHPLSAPAALLLFALAASAVALRPSCWPVLLPALLPWIGLAPWSGWIAIEELDLLVLAIAAGGHARWALRPAPQPPSFDARALFAALLFGLWTVAVAASTWRGVVAAGGLAFDPFQAYRGPMNALRLAKPTLAVWLLWPLWLRLQAAPGARATERLTLGLALGHAAAALACVWERAAFTGLLDFSSDYRSTALFWEMHVGGAALDAFLALTMPFALRLWWTARSRAGTLAAAAIVLLGSYAALTTFSRIVLLALPLAAVVMLLLQRAAPQPVGDGARHPVAVATPLQWLAAGSLCAAVVAGAAWMFPSSGYRGMLALLGNAALLLLLGPQVGRLRRREWAVAVAAALPLGALLLAGASLLPKGPYLALALALLATAAAALAARARPVWLPLACAGHAVALACTALVARYWGDAAALPRALPALAVLALALPLAAIGRVPPWPADLRWQARLGVGLLIAAVVIGLFGGGAYMGQRLSDTDADEQGRALHWRHALALRHGEAEHWLGIGGGRFVDRYAIEAGAGERPGDIRLVDADGEPAMRLIAGTQPSSWGSLLRLSQRTARPQGAVTLRVTVRAPAGTSLHADICIKHLLYDDGCQWGDLSVPKGDGEWKQLTLPLKGTPLSGDTWLLPRFTVLSLATDSSQAALDVREVSATDGRGIELLVNRRFADGGARWFFSSDRNHLPWHAKNMVVHLLVEQGRVGLAALALLTLAAATLLLTRGRRAALAPALAAALVGVWTVGLVDSLLDIPRIAVLLLLLTMVALGLRSGLRH